MHPNCIVIPLENKLLTNFKRMPLCLKRSAFDKESKYKCSRKERKNKTRLTPLPIGAPATVLLLQLCTASRLNICTAACDLTRTYSKC